MTRPVLRAPRPTRGHMSTSTSERPTRDRTTPKSMAIWGTVAVVGAICWAVLALQRGEEFSALWVLFAALASYAIAYRFYARFIAYRVLRLRLRGH